jgi:sugar phosphate isomerase/epimerase
VVDWARVVNIISKYGFHGVLSVECGTPEQAERSLAHLNKIIAAR